ncbi:MAG TPA: AAA family ATPase [Parcubacteria group bacterium]|nr:AAA family ATPase [Parcubacteria group bacterium]
MYLKSIELNGFKSFAKKSELLFNSKVSAIVGPNGSGKSNVAEAFRFVLGEQSIKSLRGKKGEDLIFNGAGDLPRGNRASVRVTFDNTSKFLPVDFDEVTIERVVHRDSVNEYLINGTQVRLKDVVELLASAHIGSSGHHIISQGEADRILNSTPKDRKGMIEDALGLKIYNYKKVESEKKLQKTKENIDKVESLRREIAPHIKFLKKQVEKVEKAIAMKEELQKEALEYCKREDLYIKTTEQEINTHKEPLLKKEKELESELNQAKEILENAKNKDGLSQRLIDLENDLHKTRNEKDELYRSFGRLDGEINSLVKMVKKQEEIAKSIEHKTVPLVSVEDLSVKIENKIKDAKQSDSVEVLIRALDEVHLLVVNFIEHNKDNVEMSLVADVQRDIENLQSSRKEIEEKLGHITKNEEKLSTEYNNLKNEIEKEKDSNRDAEKAVFRIMAESGEIRSKIQQINSEEHNLKLVKDNFKMELAELGTLIGTHVLKFQDVSISPESRELQEERRKRIEKIKIRLEDSGGLGNLDTMKEYKDATERDEFLAKELLDLENSANSLGLLIKDLEEKLSNEFKNGVEKINKQFKEYFALMFGGGEARLEVTLPQKRKKDTEVLLDMDDPDSILESDESGAEGIDIEVSLPKKKVKGLMMLSGGERALTSIALLFAISQVNPPPFIILDETDAALDEANSKKYADMVENLSKYSQLIVITHNRETMSRAGILYGVTMGSGGGSKLLSVAFEEALSVAK